MFKPKVFLLSIATFLCAGDVLLVLQHYFLLSEIGGIKNLNLTLNLLSILLLLFLAFILNLLSCYYKTWLIFLICVIIFFIFFAIF